VSWLRKRADLVEVTVPDPSGTKSGTCAFCDTVAFQPTSEVGRAPHHPHCACTNQLMESSHLPKIEDDEDAVSLDEPFTMAPADPEPETGGVTDLEEAADEA
jgi:hypothetical protein